MLPGRPSAADDGATTPFPPQVQQEGTQAPGSKALTECILALSRAVCSAHHQPAPVETSPAAAAGASLETRRLLSEERAAQAPEEESGPERGPAIVGPPVPTSGARCAPFLPRDPRAPVCSCRNLQFLMHAVVPVWCALAELRSWFAVDAERPAQRSWPLATRRVARAVCDLDNAGKEELVRTVSQLAAQELDHLAPATDHS